jgi:hypothetical protein
MMMSQQYHFSTACFISIEKVYCNAGFKGLGSLKIDDLFRKPIQLHPVVNLFPKYYLLKDRGYIQKKNQQMHVLKKDITLENEQTIRF